MARTFAASLVVPLLRQKDEWLHECIASALRQSVPCDVVVVTSPHTPRSNLDVLARLDPGDGRLRPVCRPPGVRFAGALNLGFAEAAAQRVGLVLSDDWLEPEAVEACLAHDADIVSTQARVFAADGRCELDIPALRRNRTRAALAACPDDESRARMLGHFLLLARTAVQRAGGVDETVGDTPGVDDYHLLWTMLERGASATIVEQPLYGYRDHAGERLTNRNALQMWETMRRILAKHGLAGEALEERLLWHTRWFGGPLAQTTDPCVQSMRWRLVAEQLDRDGEGLDERLSSCARLVESAATLEVHARRIARRKQMPISAALAALTDAASLGMLAPVARPA